jgi:hypothetical protein
MSDPADESGRSPARRDGRPTERFERQHAELVSLAKALGAELDTRKIAADPGPARRALAAFSGKLKVHAAMEQEALYPRLLASRDPSVAEKARALAAEVGDLYEGFFGFLARWQSAEAVQTAPDEFGRETMVQLHRLGVRMKRENRELYPLVDAIEGDLEAPAGARAR